MTNRSLVPLLIVAIALAVEIGYIFLISRPEAISARAGLTIIGSVGVCCGALIMYYASGIQFPTHQRLLKWTIMIFPGAMGISAGITVMTDGLISWISAAAMFLCYLGGFVLLILATVTGRKHVRGMTGREK